VCTLLVLLLLLLLPSHASAVVKDGMQPADFSNAEAAFYVSES
jgi:hypothetical protein